MRYQLSTTQSILNNFDVVNSIDSIVALADSKTSLREACGEYAATVNENEPIDDELFDAYFAVEKATEAYCHACIECMKQSATPLLNLHNQGCKDVRYIRDDIDADYGEIKVLGLEKFEITVHASEDEDTVVFCNENVSA